MEQKTRIAGLDLAKLLASYLVILYHLTFPNLPKVAEGGVWRIVYLFYPLMSICVPLFFAVSGALSLPKEPKLRQSLRRAVHILLLAIFWAVSSLGIILLLRGERMGAKDFLYTAYHLKIGYIQHLWFLPAFLFLTLFTPVLQALRRGSRKTFRYLIALIAVFTVGNLFLNDLEYLARWILGKTGYASYREFFWYIDYFGSLYWYMFVYAALGAWLLENRDRFAAKKRWAFLTIPLCLAALDLFAAARCHVRETIVDPVFNNYSSIFTVILTFTVLVLLLEAKPGEKISRWAAAFGRSSLGVYLIHWILIEVMATVLPGFTRLPLAPVQAACILLVSWGITELLLRVPGVRYLVSLQGRNSNSSARS